jgi:hypothetical protein
VFLNADIMDTLATSHHGRGSDRPMAVARIIAWMQMQQQAAGGQPIKATSRDIAIAFASAQLGYLVNTGLSERNLERLRPHILAAGVSDHGGGYYSVPKARRWYAYEPAALARLVFQTSNAGLRVALASAAPLSAAANKGPTVAVSSRIIAARSHQQATTVCQASRELRILGLLHDNRPGRAQVTMTQTPAGPRWRKPVRLIVTASPYAPQTRSRIVSREAAYKAAAPGLRHPTPATLCTTPEALTKPEGRQITGKARSVSAEPASPGLIEMDAPPPHPSVGATRREAQTWRHSPRLKPRDIVTAFAAYGMTAPVKTRGSIAAILTTGPILAAILDREAAATTFVGLIQGLVMQAMLVGRPTTMRPQAERVFELYLRSLGEAS